MGNKSKRERRAEKEDLTAVVRKVSIFWDIPLR
jgi:hypothetical protein